MSLRQSGVQMSNNECTLISPAACAISIHRTQDRGFETLFHAKVVLAVSVRACRMRMTDLRRVLLHLAGAEPENTLPRSVNTQRCFDVMHKASNR